MSKLVHIYPLRKGTLPELGDLTEEDVLREIANATFKENPAETVLFMGCSTEDDSGHLYLEFLQRLRLYNSARVSFLCLPDVEQHIHHPAMEARDYATTDLPCQPLSVLEKKLKVHSRQQPHRVIYTINSLLGLPTGKEVHSVDVQAIYRSEATPEHDEIRKQHRFMDLSTEHNLNLLVRIIKEQNSSNNFIKFLKGEGQHAPIRRLVIKPLLEDSLRFLQQLRQALPDLVVYVFHDGGGVDNEGVTVEGDEGGKGWRNSTKTILELSEEKSVMHIEGLLPEKSLTMVTGPAFTGKTYQALEMALVLATGESTYLGHFKGPIKPLPVVYHVPELQEKIVGDYLRRLGASDRLKGREEMLLIRTLEHDLWQLDSTQMIDSSRGRYIFLDTCGYFNDGDDSASYGQAIEFAKKINTLIREGCLGVCGVYHPPKYSKSKKETGNMMTLENQILGSAGYGGVLRSCVGMRNLHDDPAKGLWVYCQQLKVHGLQPFQVEGVPVKLIKKPGESLYLSELLKGNGSKREQAVAMMKEGKTREEIRKALGVSPRDLTKWKQEEVEFDSNSEENNNE